jgi:hypothetical protein
MRMLNFMKIGPVGAELFNADGRTDRRTDVTKQTVAFSNFVNAHKKINPFWFSSVSVEGFGN